MCADQLIFCSLGLLYCDVFQKLKGQGEGTAPRGSTHLIHIPVNSVCSCVEEETPASDIVQTETHKSNDSGEKKSLLKVFKSVPRQKKRLNRSRQRNIAKHLYWKDRETELSFEATQY